MSKTKNTAVPDDAAFSYEVPWAARLKRWGIVFGLPLVGLVILLLILWNVFFQYVPPGKGLIVIAKTGEPLEPDQVLAREGQKGILEAVRGEGWHFVMPVIYTTELIDNVVIPPGKVGIVTSKGGKPPEGDWMLVDDPDEKGIRRQVLLPGAYRLNTYGYKVDLVDAVEIPPGSVGVVRRLLKASPAGGLTTFGDDPRQTGLLADKVLQPGTYYINTKEYEIIQRLVGIYQTSYHYAPDPARSTAVSFTVKDGYTISMDCTVEWELRPDDAPALAQIFPRREDIERNVIDQLARKIARDRGFDYGAQDWLDGDKRETFQTDFETELKEAALKHRVHVGSAFIRSIIIPDSFLKLKRERQLAIETKITNEAKDETAKSDAEVERERSTIALSVAKVEAETAQMVAVIDQEVDNVNTQTEAELEQLKAEFQAKIAELDAERVRVTGGAESEAVKLRETARSSLYKLKMDVFQNSADAYLKYTLAQQLNPKLVLRVFHAGPGTLWTNLNSKDMSLLLPAPGAGVAAAPAATMPAAVPPK